MIIIINNKLQKIIIASNEITKNKNLNFILQKYKKERKKDRKKEEKGRNSYGVRIPKFSPSFLNDSA